MIDLNYISPKYLKIKGKKYARPFVIVSYLSMAEINFIEIQTEAEFMIYSAFGIPKEMMK